MFTRQELESLSRKELQKLAKDNQIRANEKSSVIIDSLLALSCTLDSGSLESEVALPEQVVSEIIREEAPQLSSAQLSSKETAPSVESCIQGIQSLNLKLEEPNQNIEAAGSSMEAMATIDSLAVDKVQLTDATHEEAVAVAEIDNLEEHECMGDLQDGELHEHDASDCDEESDEQEESLSNNETGDVRAAHKEVVVTEYRHAKLSKTSAKKVRDFLRFKNDIKMGVYRTKPRDPDFIPHNTAPKTKTHGTKVLDTKENHGQNALVTKPLEA